MVKNPPVNAGDSRDGGLILGLDDLLEDGNPLQYFLPGKFHVACELQSMGVARSQTQMGTHVPKTRWDLGIQGSWIH